MTINFRKIRKESTVREQSETLLLGSFGDTLLGLIHQRLGANKYTVRACPKTGEPMPFS